MSSQEDRIQSQNPGGAVPTGSERLVSASAAVSPYSAGGGGVSFAHRVAAIYLAGIFTGARRPETGELPVTRVSFQTQPEHPVDDLLVEATDGDRSVRLAVACRATPNFVPSDTQTVKLMRAVLAEIDFHPLESDADLVAIAVKGRRVQWDELARLTDIARSHSGATTFDTSIRTEGRWSRGLRNRYKKLLKLVDKADQVARDDRLANTHQAPSTPVRQNGLEPTSGHVGFDSGAGKEARLMGGEGSGVGALELRTWRLLTRLRIVSFDVQPPDESDWSRTATSLDSVTDGNGVEFRDRLAVSAAEYDAVGAVVDLSVLRRKHHDHLDVAATRAVRAWHVLNQHRDFAYRAVRSSLGPIVKPSDRDPSASGGTAETVRFGFETARKRVKELILQAAEDYGTVVVTGASGTGKSALTLSSIAELEKSDNCETILLNFRELPTTTIEFEASIGRPIRDAMLELSSARRVLVIDAADTAIERSSALLSDLLTAATDAKLGVVLVSADTAHVFLAEQVNSSRHHEPTRFTMDLLSDDDIALVVSHFPALSGLLRNLPASSLLRRLVVLDLLARSETTIENPMNEWECLKQIWSGLVRRHENQHFGSPQAREDALIGLAEAWLSESTADGGGMPRPVSLDSETVDALRRDHLLAPQSLSQPRAEFAHDELRKYATAIVLVRAGNIPGRLAEADSPRWALSAATLACTGALTESTGVEATFATQVRDFRALAQTYQPRWADVPIEAVMNTGQAYNCFKTALLREPPDLDLSEVLRVVQQRATVDDRMDPTRAEPALRFLVEQSKPWEISTQAFDVLEDWLQSLILADTPAGNPVRQQLRQGLLNHWATNTIDESVEESVIPRARRGRRRPLRTLDHAVIGEAFVETLAMLGADHDSDSVACLNAIAQDAPGFLAPAVDHPLSARAIAFYDPELLASLMMAYYIDEFTENRWGPFDNGIRMHQGRWTGPGSPLAAYWFGGFWSLFQYAAPQTSVRVLNTILNHAAQPNHPDNDGYPSGPEIDEPWQADDAGETQETGPTGTKTSAGIQTQLTRAELTTMDLTDTPVEYLGDAGVWSWYRGTTVGPGPCMSALQAMERIAERWLASGLAPQQVADLLLEGCQNLAVPGVLYGLLVRHLDHPDETLGRFIREPLVWQLESSRITHEHLGPGAETEGLKNLDRRAWTPGSVCMRLVVSSDEDQRKTLRSWASHLRANGARQGIEDLTDNWASSLEAERFEVVRSGDNVLIQVIPPDRVREAQEQRAEAEQLTQEVMRLLNKYRGAAKYPAADYQPPTAAEIAADLSSAEPLLENAPQDDVFSPVDAVAHLARTAIERAAAGEPEALGAKQEHADFAVRVILTIAEGFVDSPVEREEGQFNDAAADRACALVLPALLTPALEPSTNRIFDAVGAPHRYLDTIGTALAGKSSLETRLYLARGCDIVWHAPCHSNPCIHSVALNWMVETGRQAEIALRGELGQRHQIARIEGDLLQGLEQLDPESIDIRVLDAAIRATGAAAVTPNCMSATAADLVARLLVVQRQAMVAHPRGGYAADDRAHHTLIAARALLQIAHSGDPHQITAHLDALSSDARLLSNFLHGLAAAGAETPDLAATAVAVWPTVLLHAVTFASNKPNPFSTASSSGEWAAAALLPEPLTWARGMYNEIDSQPIDWVNPDTLNDLIDAWTPIARGKIWCLGVLIRYLPRLPPVTQVTRGLRWVHDICVYEGEVVLSGSAAADEWLIRMRTVAEEHRVLRDWQTLVDYLVVGGNSQLAAYST